MAHQKILSLEAATKKLTPSQKELLKTIAGNVRTAGLCMELIDDRYVYCYPGDYSLASRTSGWYDPEGVDEQGNPCAIQVATRKPAQEWLSTLAHEYSHFCQEQDGNTFEDYNIAMDKLEKWTEHKIELGPEESFDYAQTIVTDELDAEERTVKLLKEFGILNGKEIREYIQSANAYLMGYSIIALSHHWWDIAPYELKAINNRMPSWFLKPEEYRTAYIPYVKLYYKHCLKIKAPKA